MPGYNHYDSCTCGWCSGGGGYSVTPVYAVLTQIHKTWDHDDFCRPTTCPHCGDEVFFVRHNGGSVWFDPPLGPPWDKHGCFDDLYPAACFRTELRENKVAAVFGVVTEIEVVPGEISGRVVVKCSDGSTVEKILHPRLAAATYIGALVFVERSKDSVRFVPVKWKERSRIQPIHGSRITLDRVDYVWRGHWLSCQDNIIVSTALQQRLNDAFRNDFADSSDDDVAGKSTQD